MQDRRHKIRKVDNFSRLKTTTSTYARLRSPTPASTPDEIDGVDYGEGGEVKEKG